MDEMRPIRLVIVTGLSGAGKSQAIRVGEPIRVTVCRRKDSDNPRTFLNCPSA